MKTAVHPGPLLFSTVTISNAKAGGILRREVWVDYRARVVRDTSLMSTPLSTQATTASPPFSWQNNGEIEARFQKEWSQLVKEAKHARD